MNKRQQKKQMKKQVQSLEYAINFVKNTVTKVMDKIKEDPQFVLNRLMETNEQSELKIKLIAMCLHELKKQKGETL